MFSTTNLHVQSRSALPPAAFALFPMLLPIDAESFTLEAGAAPSPSPPSPAPPSPEPPSPAPPSPQPLVFGSSRTINTSMLPLGDLTEASLEASGVGLVRLEGHIDTWGTVVDCAAGWLGLTTSYSGMTIHVAATGCSRALSFDTEGTVSLFRPVSPTSPFWRLTLTYRTAAPNVGVGFYQTGDTNYNNKCEKTLDRTEPIVTEPAPASFTYTAPPKTVTVTPADCVGGWPPGSTFDNFYIFTTLSDAGAVLWNLMIGK